MVGQFDHCQQTADFILHFRRVGSHNCCGGFAGDQAFYSFCEQVLH
jgi:hypothetical protein